VFNSPLVYLDPSGHCGVKKGKFDGKYDCTANDFNAATMKQRLAWFKGFLAVTGREEWFSNIIAILQAFIDEGLGDTNSWISWVDAGILESIQNGWALFVSRQTNNNPADMAWMNFFATDDIPANETTLKQLWGAAEEAGTTYGKQLADKNNAYMNEREKLFLEAGDVYRGWLKNQTGDDFFGMLAGGIGGMINLPLLPICGSCYILTVTQYYTGGSAFGNWFTDPRSTLPIVNKAPVYYFARIILEK
jgi:hypothetical protein